MGTLIFNSVDRVQCFNVTIVNDNIVEYNESFSMVLTPTDSRFTGDSATVVIIDNDGKK